MKNALLAVIIAILLVYAFGNLLSDGWGIHLMMGDDMLSPLENFAAFTVVGVIFVIIGVVVAISVVGALFLAAFAGLAVLLIAGFTALWPVAVVAVLVWLLIRKRTPHAA